jgi:hypothetical protein
MASYIDIINALRWGRRGKTVTPTTAAPTGTQTLLLAANVARISATFVNAGSVTVYIGPTSAVTTSTGMPIIANGFFTDDSSTSAWYGVTTGSAGDMRMAEVTA